MKIKVGTVTQPLTGWYFTKSYKFLDYYQNSKHDIIEIAYIVVNHCISVFFVSSVYNRIRDQ